MTQKPTPTTVQTRLQHADENTHDYLEVIADLLAEHGEARLVDIAARLGVSKGTVSKKLRLLQREGHIHTEPYRAVFLSDTGAALAEAAKTRHRTVLEFLMAAGVPGPVAQLDAEGIEHHVSPETLEAMSRLTRDLAPRAAAKKPAPRAKR